jgi:hypothetical protein
VFPDFHELHVAMKLSKKLVVSIALIAACAFAVWVSFGPHLRRASRDIIDETFYCAPRYVALRESQFEAERPAEGVVRCVFGGLSFGLPSTMAGQSMIVRSSPSTIWLVFEDHGRFMQMLLSPPAPGSMISTPPPELANTTVPGLLATIAAVSTGDFSLGFKRSELRVYEWAIANRKSLDLDGQSMDRYAVRSSETLDAILISADPSATFPDKQIRSWLVWQATECRQSGSMCFGDWTKEDADWINALATSVEFIPVVATNDVAAEEFSTMADDEILKMLKTFGPIQPST